VGNKLGTQPGTLYGASLLIHSTAEEVKSAAWNLPVSRAPVVLPKSRAAGKGRADKNSGILYCNAFPPTVFTRPKNSSIWVSPLSPSHEDDLSWSGSLETELYSWGKLDTSLLGDPGQVSLPLWARWT
jgi:hypothetical protein